MEKICEICKKEIKKGQKFCELSFGVEIICGECAYRIFTRKCVRCGHLFISPEEGNLIPCPFCDIEEDAERFGRKATKKDIDAVMKNA